MRVLCLRFPVPPEPSWVEAFLSFTPRIARRGTLLFLEISSTQHLFGGEAALLQRASSLAEKLAGRNVPGAVADTAATAQVLSAFRAGAVGRREGDAVEMREQPIESLRELEGLVPWPSAVKTEAVISFFQALGFEKLGDLQSFSRSSLEERWGEWGLLLWRRLQARDAAVISPWTAREPLVGYAFFEEPASQIEVLNRKFEPVLETLFLRIEGQALFARSVSLILHCEWSGQRHCLEARPVTAGRDVLLFRDLLVRKLESLDLGNPVKELEVIVDAVPEKVQQLDFFEPRETSESRWQRLISFAHQGEIQMGFLQPMPSTFPEDAAVFRPAVPETFEAKDEVEKVDDAVQVRPTYAKAVSQAPRPSLLLEPPRELDPVEAARLRRLTPIPAERMLGPWWNKRPAEGRDYYYALSPEGRLLWVFRDKDTRKVFLHGAFD